jgi:plastocyanin
VRAQQDFMRFHPPPSRVVASAPEQPAGSMRSRGRSLFVALATWAGLAAAAPVEVRVQDAAGRPLAGAVVFLESSAAREQSKPLTGVEISQADRQFQPQVTVVPRGSAVNFPNRDTVRHHVYSFSSAKRFEIKLYVGTPAQPVVFDQPGIAVLGCNIHDHMAAWVVVVETPWYGRSDGEGRWANTQVPPGTYRLRTWHPSLPPDATPADQALQVGAAGANATVRLAGVGS